MNTSKMSSSKEEKLLETIKYYRDGIIKHSKLGNDAKILHYISKLYDMPITVAHLQETGVGRTINSLRKCNGDVGNASRTIVGKWKEMVEKEDNENEEEENEEEEDEHENPDVSPEREESEHEESSPYEIEEKTDKKSHESSHKSSSPHRSSKSHHHSSHKSSHKSRSSHKSSSDNKSCSPHRSRSPHKKEEKKQKHHSSHSVEKTNNHRNPEIEHKDKHRKRSHDKERKHHNHESHSKRKRHESEDEVSEQEQQEEEEDIQIEDDFENISSPPKQQSSYKEPKLESKTPESRSSKHKKHHKSDKEKHSKDDEKPKKEKHKHSSHKRDKSDKVVDKTEKIKSPEKKDKSQKSPTKVKKLPENEGIDSGSGTSFAEALGMIEPSTSRSSSKKKFINDKILPCDKSSSPINKPRVETPQKSQSPIDQSPALLSSTVKLEPLELNLPEITTNYKPLGYYNVNLNASGAAQKLSDEEALSKSISSKNQRTKVYSGNKTGYSHVPSLFNLCVKILQENIEYLEYTGGVPYQILKPVLERATPDQLHMAEQYNPYLLDDSDELWEVHCKRYFRAKHREEMESWRDMYMRCLDERESKLKALTANIKQSIDKSIPVRQTKLAYVDSVVKPPRAIARKQAKYGTDKKPVVTPMARLNSIATSGNATSVSVPNPSARASSSSSSAIKPKKAPLMQKTLALIKNRYRR